MLIIKLLPDVRTTLAAAVRLADLVRLDFSQPYSNAIKEHDIIDYDFVEQLRTDLDTPGASGSVPIEIPDLAGLYGLLDVLCKGFFTPFAAVLQKEFITSTAGTDADFVEYRQRLLATSTRIFTKCRQLAGTRPTYLAMEAKLAQLESMMQ